MNKIIVVGHPQSGLEQVHELLTACGMLQALPSRREGFTPVQISEALLKTHGVVPVQQVCSADELQQIDVAPLWQGLALDLMLGNMEQTLWGWIDIQAVYLLDYWKSQDPKTIFVLVYGAPESVLLRHAVEDLQTEPEALQSNLNAWVAYNAAMLSFYLRNPERSMLVHADQVKVSATQYVELLNTRTNVSLQLPDVSQLGPLAEAKTAESSYPHTLSLPGLQGNALGELLAQQVVQEQPEAGELYAQLQAAATMPLRAQLAGQSMLSAQDLLLQRYQAWAVFVTQQLALQQSATWRTQLQKAQEELNTCQVQTQKLVKKLAELPKLQADLKAAQQVGFRFASTELEKENLFLLTRLLKAQEELERYYLKTRQVKAVDINEPPKPKKGYYGAADRVKKQLSYRLGAIMIKKSGSLGGWLCMPFALNAEYKRFKQEQTKLEKNKLPSLAQYSDAHEAEKIKKHLSYRLGARMIANSKSVGGWIVLPWELFCEVKKFRKEQNNQR